MVNVGAKPAQVQQQNMVESKQKGAQKSSQTGSDVSFAEALGSIGKNISSFVPQVNQNAKIYDTKVKKIKPMMKGIEDEIPTIEDEAAELLGKIEKLMEKYSDR